jgi:hypothetical protein
LAGWVFLLRTNTSVRWGLWAFHPAYKLHATLLRGLIPDGLTNSRLKWPTGIESWFGFVLGVGRIAISLSARSLTLLAATALLALYALIVRALATTAATLSHPILTYKALALNWRRIAFSERLLRQLEFVPSHHRLLCLVDPSAEQFPFARVSIRKLLPEMQRSHVYGVVTCIMALTFLIWLGWSQLNWTQTDLRWWKVAKLKNDGTSENRFLELVQELKVTAQLSETYKLGFAYVSQDWFQQWTNRLATSFAEAKCKDAPAVDWYPSRDFPFFFRNVGMFVLTPLKDLPKSMGRYESSENRSRPSTNVLTFVDWVKYSRDDEYRLGINTQLRLFPDDEVAKMFSQWSVRALDAGSRNHVQCHSVLYELVRDRQSQISSKRDRADKELSPVALMLAEIAGGLPTWYSKLDRWVCYPAIWFERWLTSKYKSLTVAPFIQGLLGLFPFSIAALCSFICSGLAAGALLLAFQSPFRVLAFVPAATSRLLIKATLATYSPLIWAGESPFVDEPQPLSKLHHFIYHPWAKTSRMILALSCGIAGVHVVIAIAVAAVPELARSILMQIPPKFRAIYPWQLATILAGVLGFSAWFLASLVTWRFASGEQKSGLLDQPHVAKRIQRTWLSVLTIQRFMKLLSLYTIANALYLWASIVAHLHIPAFEWVFFRWNQ